MSAIDSPLYCHAGGAMLRAAMLPLHRTPTCWPTLSNLGSCRTWLRSAWALPGFADAVRYASSSFATLVDTVLDDEAADGKQVRRVTLSVIRYLLRTVGRPTPFGLFAGVAPVRVDSNVQVAWGGDHRAMIRADTLWLDDVVERLESLPAALPHLNVVFSDLVIDRGDRIEMPRGPGRVTVRNTAVVRLVRDAAATPITFTALSDKIDEAFPGVPPSKIHEALASLVAQGVLISSLRAPMTVTDPLEYLIEALDHRPAGTSVDQVGPVADDLRDIARIMREHNAADTRPDDQARLRGTLTERMRRVSTTGRTALAGDLHLDCRVTVPDELAREMAHAVTALMRLTRQPRPDQGWNDWCREFWDRYGTGALVPVTEAVHPDAGIGLPAGFPASVWAPPEDTVSRRDEELLRLAWEAVTGGRREIVLTDDLIEAITADDVIDPRWIPPHVELGARVHAASAQALREGDYTFTVHPAWAFGTLTCRFGPTVTRAGLDAVYAGVPSGIDGALSVQMSFPPLFPHSENVARIPAYLSYVLPLGEHRADDGSRVIRLEDLGIVAVADGLHLVSISRRRIIEPQVFHALALQKQAPPVAHFLATLTRGFSARYTEFDWGPQAACLPYLPRVRYRRAILSPATWRITSAEYAAMIAQGASWDDVLTRWRQRWNCPDTVELHDDHRSLRLTLTAGAHLALLREHLDKHGAATLTETESAEDTKWMGGHVHEIVMPIRPRHTTDAKPGYRPASAGHQLDCRAASRVAAGVLAVCAGVHPSGTPRRHHPHPPAPAAGCIRRRSRVLVRPLPRRARDRSPTPADPHRRSGRVRRGGAGRRPVGATALRRRRGFPSGLGDLSSRSRPLRKRTRDGRRGIRLRRRLPRRRSRPATAPIAGDQSGGAGRDRHGGHRRRIPPQPGRGDKLAPGSPRRQGRRLR
jgi:hypothetical protein